MSRSAPVTCRWRAHTHIYIVYMYRYNRLAGWSIFATDADCTFIALSLLLNTVALISPVILYYIYYGEAERAARDRHCCIAKILPDKARAHQTRERVVR